MKYWHHQNVWAFSFNLTSLYAYSKKQFYVYRTNWACKIIHSRAEHSWGYGISEWITNHLEIKYKWKYSLSLCLFFCLKKIHFIWMDRSKRRHTSGSNRIYSLYAHIFKVSMWQDKTDKIKIEMFVWTNNNNNQLQCTQHTHRPNPFVAKVRKDQNKF